MNIRVDSVTELKTLRIEDAEIIFKTIDSERFHLGKWLPFVEHTKTTNDTLDFVKSVINLPEAFYNPTFIICRNGKFAGLIGLKDTDLPNKKSEIGYWLSEKFQGQGIMTRSVQTLCSYAFEALQLNRVQIKCAVENIPSKKIPQRLNFTLEGIERQGELLTGGTFTDLEIYSLLNSSRKNTKLF